MTDVTDEQIAAIRERLEALKECPGLCVGLAVDAFDLLTKLDTLTAERDAWREAAQSAREVIDAMKEQEGQH